MESLPSSRASRSSSSSSKNYKELSLDLSDLPPLVTPSPPSNTLIITNLHDPSVFHPANLATIRNLLDSYAQIHSFAPLKSFSRIIVTFYNTEAATSIRQSLDGTMLMESRIRVYFGNPTPLNNPDQHLELPKSAKLFFISPPPSPPHGWEMRNEDPPNKQVHAEDLAQALAKLHATPTNGNTSQEPCKDIPSPATEEGNPEISPRLRTRRRGSSTIVYHPEDHGDSPDLPAIAVEDTTATMTESPTDYSPMEVERPQFMHTARPPVELIHHA
jgi:hypothetical protein